MAGTATPAQSPLSPVAFGWCSTGTFTYDPALAQSMLQSAGAQSMHLTLAAPEGRDAADTTVAQAVAGDLEAIGLRVTVTVEPSWPRYLQQITSSAGNASDLALLGWAPASTDGTEGLAAFTRAGWPPAGLGFSRFDDPTADQLIARAASATGRANRQQALCQASRIIWQAAPAIFLCSRQLTAVAQKGVSGLHTQPDDALVTTWATPG
jgi:ABC-type transport system substrate-binding protein